MSGKQEKRFRKLYRPLALGKVDADLGIALAKHRRVMRRNKMKNALIFVLLCYCAGLTAWALTLTGVAR